MRLVTNNTIGGPPEFRSTVESTTARLREAVSILQAIDTGDLLAELPPGQAGARQQCAISLLAVLERELQAIIKAQDEQLQKPEPCIVLAE